MDIIDLIVIAISIVGSLIIDIAIDYRLMKNCGLFSDEHKSLLKFARNNKNIKDYQDIFEGLDVRIQELDQRITKFPAGSDPDVSELLKEINRLKEAVANMQPIPPGSSNPETSQLQKYTDRKISELQKDTDCKISELQKDTDRKISELEKKLKGYVSSMPAPYDNDIKQLNLALIELTKRVYILENRQAINNPNPENLNGINAAIQSTAYKLNKLNSEMISLKSAVYKQQDRSNNKEYEEKINVINENITLLKKIIGEHQKTIGEHQKIIESLKSPKTENPTKPPVPSPVFKPRISDNKIIPDKKYVMGLISNLSLLKGNLGAVEYNCYEKELLELKDEGEFDDAEEIMTTVHELIEKYIYGSDTKVTVEAWKYLEKYIEKAGYKAVKIKPGDDVTPYRTYFSRPIAASGGIPNTVKNIQLQPYILTYRYGGTEETLKLCGKCTYYSGVTQ